MLDALQLAVIAAAGLAAGVVSGLFGVGGGVLMVPAALYVVPGTGFHLAKAASLVVICVSAGIGVRAHARRKSVDFRTGALLAAAGVGGSVVSVLAIERVEDAPLRVAFGLVLAVTGARLALGAPPAPRELSSRARFALVLALGAASGLLAGAFGIGGGIVVVPGLVLAGVGMHVAVGTSLVAVLANALVSTTTHVAIGYGPGLLALGVPLALGAAPGVHLGSVWAHKLHADKLRRAFGWALVAMGAWMGLDAAW